MTSIHDLKSENSETIKRIESILQKTSQNYDFYQSIQESVDQPTLRT